MDNFADGVVAGMSANNNNGYGNGFGYGGDWIWVIVLFALFGWGGNGFGWGGGNNGALTRGDLCQDMNFSDLENGVRGISQGICDSTFALNNTITNGFAGVQQSLCQGFNGIDRSVANLGFQLQSCCCDLSRQIDGVNYNMAKNTCDITNAINGSTQQILGFLTQEKISSLQSENAALTAQLSQNSQTQTIINALQPVAKPAYITCSPYQSSYGFGLNNGGCGCGGCGC